MTRVVRAADGRSWTVRSEINWSQPATAQEFEHDVAAGQVAGIVMMVIIVVMVLTVVFWTPPTVVIPFWLVLIFLGLLALIPAQWALNRPWTIVADTPEPVETAGEHWVGTVRGIMGSRAETSRVARHLELHAVPDDGRGRLQPIY
jgi:hypothetical protein